MPVSDWSSPPIFFFVVVLVLLTADGSQGIRCYEQDVTALQDCTAAGTCEATSLQLPDASGQDFNISAVAYTTPDLTDFAPPYPPILNMTVRYATCYFAVLTVIPDTSPDGASISDALSLFGVNEDEPNRNPHPPPTATTPTAADDYDADLATSGAVVMQGGGTADPSDPFHNYSTCMNTWSTLQAELMLAQAVLGGTYTLFYYCCTTTGCNYGRNGANPGTAPPPHPKNWRRPRPPPLSSPPRSSPSPHQPTPTEAVSAGGDGAIIGLRVFLAILLVVVVAGGVWFLHKQSKPTTPLHGSSGDGAKVPTANSESAGLLTGQLASNASNV